MDLVKSQEQRPDTDMAGPRCVTSRRRIVYRKSAWRVHRFEVWSGELVCRGVALRAGGALLLWLGGARPALGDVVLGLPGGLATALAAGPTDADGAASALARRLATALERPVYVCLGTVFDRFTTPLVERGLIAEIKSRPDCF